MTTSDELLRFLTTGIPPSGPNAGGGNYTYETLTFTGGLITDAVREADVQGDGATPPAGVGVWPAATNLITNGGFETDTTGWTAGGTNTITRTDAHAKFGTHSAFLAYADNATLASFGITLTAAAHSTSIWVRVPASYDGTDPEVQMTGFVGASGTLTANIDLSIRDAWQRVVVQGFTPAGGDLAGFLAVVENGVAPTVGRGIYIDGAQVETGGIATPYIETDGGTANRALGTVQQSVSGLLTPTQGWVFARVSPGFANTATAVVGPRVMSFGDSDAKSQQIIINTGSPAIVTVNRRNNDGSDFVTIGTLTFAANAAFGVLFRWTPTDIGGALNGASITTGANTSIPTYAATTLYIGSRLADGLRQLRGRVLWWVTGSGTVTAEDSAALNAFGDAPPTWAQIKGALPAAAQLTGLWDCVSDQFQQVSP